LTAKTLGSIDSELALEPLKEKLREGQSPQLNQVLLTALGQHVLSRTDLEQLLDYTNNSHPDRTRLAALTSLARQQGFRVELEATFKKRLVHETNSALKKVMFDFIQQ
jgi:hypothetical protein